MEHLLQSLKNFCTKEEHSKGTILLKEGSMCKKVYFVEKGTLRFYYINDEGLDITHWFLLENQFITEVTSFLEKTGSEYYLEVLEDCTLYSFTYETYSKINSIFPEAHQLFSSVLIKLLLEFGEKIKDLQFRNAKTRYDNLLAKHPDILQRVALKHIASYLGITQQSLSRIRKINSSS